MLGNGLVVVTGASTLRDFIIFAVLGLVRRWPYFGNDRERRGQTNVNPLHLHASSS